VGVVTSSRFNAAGETSGQRTFLVKAIDTSGNYSATAAVMLLNLGDPVISNVILTDSEAPAWTGTLSGGTVNGSDQLEADQVGGFYNPLGGSILYNASPTSDFYEDEYETMTYAFDYVVDGADAGSQVTVAATVDTATSYQIDYIPPSSTGDFVPFPGFIRHTEAGTYAFRLTVPSQFGGTPPTVDDIIVSLDVEDVTESLENVSIANTGTRLPITKTYRGIAFVSLTLQTDGSGAASLKIDDKDPDDGPLVYAYNAAGTAVATTIDAFIRGY